jgi:hypothetical protein
MVGLLELVAFGMVRKYFEDRLDPIEMSDGSPIVISKNTYFNFGIG